MHFLNILSLDLLFPHEFVSAPETDLGHATFQVKADPEFYFISRRDTGDAELQCLPRELPIGIGYPFNPITEDILDGFIRFGNSKLSKEALLLVEGSLVTKRGDFVGRRMNSVIVVAVNLLIQHGTRLLDCGDVLPHTRSHDMILEPLIRTLHLPLGCR